jgi:hypothetical protein
LYTLEYWDPNLRTYLNKSLDKTKLQSIKQYVSDKVIKYIKENQEIILDNIEKRHLPFSADSKKRYLKIFGSRMLPKIESLLLSSIPKETECESFRNVIQSFASHVANQELGNLSQKYWLYSLNIRGFMKHFVLIESEKKINKLISAVCNDPQYIHKNRKIPNTKDLEFPFLLYHNEIMRMLPKNYTAYKLKQIAKKVEGFIDHVSLNELIFLVTHEYYKDFKYMMGTKPMIIGKNSYLEQIKSIDANVYIMIMNYLIVLLRYIESIEEKQLTDTRGNLKLFEENIKT